MFLRVFKLSGHSMEPTFSNGAVVFSSTIPYWFSSPQKGDIIVFQKDNKNFVKRIITIENGTYFVAGDNTHDSLDSRTFGSIKRREICGKVIACIDK